MSLENNQIRSLKFEDEDEIVSLIHNSLKNQDELHIAGLLPTLKNSYTFYRFEILPILLEDDPIYGFFQNGKLTGLSCCSTKINTIYQLKYKISIGVITIVDPSSRRGGIGTKLRTKLGRKLFKMGVKKFVFEIKHDNEASLSNAQEVAKKLKASAKIVSLKFEGDTNVF